MISTSASAIPLPATSGFLFPRTSQNFHQIWKSDFSLLQCNLFHFRVPFNECKSAYESELSLNRTQKAIGALTDLFQVICGGTTGAISKCLSQTIKYTAYAENMYIAYLLSLVACQLNGMDFQHEAEILHRRALCIGIRCIGSGNPLLADSMEWLAFSLYRQGNNKEALLLCTSALVLMQTSLGAYHPDTGNCYLNLSVVLESLGVKQHADDIQQKGKTIISEASGRRPKTVLNHSTSRAGVDYSQIAVVSQSVEKAAILSRKGYGNQGLSVS